jgi:hypothetical protein
MGIVVEVGTVKLTSALLAVPPAVKLTVNGALVSPVRVNLNVTPPGPVSLPDPSIASTATTGRGVASSSTMVPSPLASEIVALLASDRVTVSVSAGSTSRSSLVATVTVLLVCPARNFRVVVEGTAV